MRALRLHVLLAGAALLLPALALAADAAAPAVPARPEQLTYPPFRFVVPKADRYRHQLRSGIPVYVAEDHSLPLVNISITLRLGEFVEPAGKTGLASLVGTMMRKGGTASKTPIEYDERADFLAASISSAIGETSGSASLNALSNNLGPSLDLLFDMLANPRFDQARLDIEKGNLLEGMKQRNDDAGDIASREWDWLIYGHEHFSSRHVLKSDLDAIGRDDLVAFHRAYVRPEHVAVIAISGDVDTNAILAEIERRLAGWKPEGKAAAVPWPPPVPQYVPKPGLYYVEKDIPQGKVFIGSLATTWRDPDHLAAQVMNYVLGGGSFTSRITKKVRSDEGLAYSAGSSFGVGTWWPADFRVYYQSKSQTVALAAKLSIDEVRRIREQPVTADELAVAENSLVETFPRRFETPAAIVGLYAMDEYLGRPHSYWEQYQDNVRKLTVADVQRVARKYLDPDKLVMLVVGKWSDIAPGDPGKRATMSEFGTPTRLPLRDPLTLQPIP